MPSPTPWGESYDALATAVLKDNDAPPVLLLAAFLYKHGEERRLRELVRRAVELRDKERAGA